MHLFAIDPWWSDFYTVWGFYVGVFGTVIGIGGFWIAIAQIQKTKHAAEAARAAANSTLVESKGACERFVGSYASRLLSELQRAVSGEEWRLADIRAHDLAELLGSLPAGGRVSDRLADLRAFGQVFDEKANGRRSRIDRERWKELLASLHTRLDNLRAPFREDHHDEGSSSNPQSNTPGVRRNSNGEDPTTAGELGTSPE